MIKKLLLLSTLFGSLLHGNEHVPQTGSKPLTIETQIVPEKQILYAPWRDTYMNKVQGPQAATLECPFCDQFNQSDEEKYLIIKRFNNSIVMMNGFPYNAGHILVLPIEHKANLEDLSFQARTEIMEVITSTKQILEIALNPEGFNIGINLGIAGSGGIPSHLHVHILPRWKNDHAFITTLGNTAVISKDINKLYATLKELFNNVALS